MTAPSGFGKTTLLRSWVDSLPAGERTLVWVALTAEVATRRKFWQLVCATAARRGDLSARAHRALRHAIDTVDDPVPAIAELLEGRRPVLLVVDAFEHLRGIVDEIEDDITRLTAAVDGLEVAITTRAATRLYDDLLAMRGLVRVIDESELRFTTGEVRELLEMHAPHAIDAAERIVRDTRGYPLAVRAVVYALGRLQSAPSLDSDAWQRLVTEELKSQIADPALVEFILDTSVPPFFDRELAGQLAHVDGAEVDRALNELAWNGFGRWISYAREQPAFQYVESVRDVFLRQIQVETPERYQRAAGIAAAWLHRKEDDDLALGLAIDAGRFDLASSICSSLILSNPDVYTTDLFERDLRRVPRRLLPRYPVLAFILGMTYAANPATRASAAEYLRIAAKHALDDAARLGPRDVFLLNVGREVCLRYLGHTQEASTAATAGLRMLESMSATDREELGDFVPMALGIFAYSLFHAGEVGKAVAVANQAVTSAIAPWWRNYASASLSCIEALNGHLPAARAALAMTEPPASGRERPMPHTLGITGRAALHLDELEFAAALDEYAGLGPLADAAQSWPFIAWVTMHARLGLGEAGPEAHRIDAALATKPHGLGPNLPTAAMLNALAILWIADGRVAKARPLLRADNPCSGQLAPAKLLYQLVTGDPSLAVRSVAGMRAEPGHTIRSTTAVDTLGAAAALRVGNEHGALELLERAASRHQLFGVRVHLLYLPDADLAALRELARQGGSAACEAYLAAPASSPITSAESPPVLLTPREVAVLSAWAIYRTRADVANALFVSTNTVRSQLNSAYRKLGVTTKDAAIQRAIELDILYGPAD